MNYIVNPFTGKFDATGNDTDYWSKSTNQTGLTGDKSGSFDLTTTGIIQSDQIGIGIAPESTHKFDIYEDGDVLITDYVSLQAGKGKWSYITEYYGSKNPATSTIEDAFSVNVAIKGAFDGTLNDSYWYLYDEWSDAYRIYIDFNGNTGFGQIPTEKFTIKDGGSSFNRQSRPYIFGVHTDDDNPYLAGFFNDTFSTTVPVFEYFGWSSTSGDFVAGDFEMGSPTANKVAIYTNGYTNPRLIIYGDGTAEFTNNLTTVGITASGIIRANLGSIIKAGQKLVLDGG
jgi:hypothetical protein